MVKKTLERYANIVTDELMKADYVPGVVKVINYLNRRNVPCFIVSGSDENELNHVLSLRKIADKFCKILGSPATKIENMERIKDYGGLYYPAVLFGDAKIDMQVAQKYGIDFCYISGFSDWNCSDASIEDLGYTVLYDFNEVVNT